jgi:septum site-determining protein MinC
MQHLLQVETTLSINPAPAAATPTPVAGAFLAKLHNERVRSGQCVTAEGQDLVLTNVLSHGGELVADGSIHVYSKAQGRIMAGAKGNTQARIYCLQFYPQIVSIAGVFFVFETLPEEVAGKAVQIWLENGELQLKVLES